VDGQPDHPGHEPAELEPLDVGDGLAAADGGEIALVPVVERRRLGTAQPVSIRRIQAAMDEIEDQLRPA